MACPDWSARDRVVKRKHPLSCPPDLRDSGDEQATVHEQKVIFPAITSWMKEPGWAGRAPHSDTISLRSVAVRTRPGEVVEVIELTIRGEWRKQEGPGEILRPPADRNDVVNLEPRAGRHQAVFAGVTCAHLHDHSNVGVQRVVASLTGQTLQHMLEGRRLKHLA
jgi:hypothetical protein